MKKLSLSELNRISLEEFKASEKIPLVVVLDDIRSQNNIGSIFRTADAFRISEICLCGITATPPHREIHKTALGAEDSVTWRYFETSGECLQNLKQRNYQILAVEQAEESISLPDFDPSFEQPLAIVLGNEVNGVSDEAMDQVDACIEIPQYGTKHSLNVSIAAGIVIWDIFEKYAKR